MKKDKPSKSAPLTVEEIQDLSDALREFDKELELAQSRVEIKGKSFAEAQKEQASWPFYYGAKKAQLGIIYKRMEARVFAIRGRLHRTYKENDSLASSERQIEKYIDSNEEYLSAVEMLLYVEEVYKQYVEVLDSGFEKRGFALRDLTAARVKEFQNEII